MAIIYQATITPPKPEFIAAWLDRQPWGGTGPIEMIGGYRFDDPDGEVGVESILLRRGELTLQAALTYRSAPLDGADDHLIATVDHSVLGQRWVYDAVGDPVAVACYRRALDGEQEQAVMEIWEGDRMIDRRDPAVRIHRRSAQAAGGAATADDVVAAVADQDPPLLIARVVSTDIPGGAQLVAEWADGQAVVAAQ